MILWAVFLAGLLAAPGAGFTNQPNSLRIAAWNSALTRDGPGLLLRDILVGDSGDIDAGLAMLANLRPDILLVEGFDQDWGLAAARALASALAARGHDMPHLFSLPPNSGMPTGLDLDGDGRRAGPGDAQGFGAFSGQGGLLVLSRFPIDAAGARDFSAMLWSSLPGNLSDDPPAVASVQRLHSVAAWQVPVNLPNGATLTLLARHAGTPAFGRGDRNARRNYDENMFWVHLLDGELGLSPPPAPFVLIGTANLDPVDGLGDRDAISAMLLHPAMQDVTPKSAETEPHLRDAGVNAGQRGDPLLDTADWPDADGPGNLRVQYVLPSRGLDVIASGIAWPARVADNARRRHGAVWLDIGWQGGLHRDGAAGDAEAGQ